MVHIAYGIASEGMGHCTRSDAVIQYLLKQGHTVDIFTSGRAYDVLKKKYKSVYKIKGFHLVHNESSVSLNWTVLSTITHLPKGFIPTLRTLARVFHKNRPQVIISDFEFFTAAIGKLLVIPVIAANNISIIDQTHGGFKDIPLLYPELLTWTSAKLATFQADAYVIPTFFFPKPLSDKVVLTNPSVRESVAKAIPTNGSHVLVYYTSSKRVDLLDTLKGVDALFKIYGFGKKAQDKNLQFLEFSEEQFISDLASAKAVIASGGFSLISECLFLKKPMFSIPLDKQFEQILNARMLEEKGFGVISARPTAKDIEGFLDKLSIYKKALNEYSFDHVEFAREVERLANKLAIKPDQNILNRLYETVRRRAVRKIRKNFMT